MDSVFQISPGVWEIDMFYLYSQWKKALDSFENQHFSGHLNVHRFFQKVVPWAEENSTTSGRNIIKHASVGMH